MRILIIGAGGFIGRHIVPVLLSRGHTVVCAGRATDSLRQRFPECDTVQADIAHDDTETWQQRLHSVDGVINAAGTLRGDVELVHHRGPVALFDACARAGIAQLVQISALGAGQQNDSRFLTTKNAADKHLIRLATQESRRGWCVLRPSLVIGRGGASTSLFSALAATPWPIRLGDGTWCVQPLHIRDVARIASELIERPSLPPVLNALGPEPMTTDELTATLRAWLGLPTRPFVPIPKPLITAAARIGDLLPAGQLSTETLTMLARGNTADVTPLQDVLGWSPGRLRDALALEPAARADRWLARLLPARLFLRAALIAVWIGSGLASFALARDRAAALLSRVADPGVAVGITWSGAALDVMLGLALLARRYRRAALQAQLLVMAIYTLLATIIAPELWADPFGALLKNIAVFAATWALLAIED